MSKAVLTLGNVKSFRGHAVNDWIVKVTPDEFVKVLNNSYGDAIVCNVAFAPGDVLRQVSPLLFQAQLNDYQEETQITFLSQLTQGNDVDIDYHD
jgi:hypothetical protein